MLQNIKFFCNSIFKILFNLFILFFWLHWVFIAACGLFSLVAVSGGYSSLWCASFSLRWLLLLRSTGSRHAGSVVAACRPQGAWASVVVAHSLSSCGTLTLLFCSVWDLPRPGIKPMCPALAGGFLTTVPPGKSQLYLSKTIFFLMTT